MMSNVKRTQHRQTPVTTWRRFRATRVVATTLGVAAGLLGLEHGYFETQQGNVATSALMINAMGPPCQPTTAWHACEPAFTLAPSFLVAGVLAMVVAVVVLIWSAAFVQRDHGGVVLLLLAILLFLVGGGFYTLLFGVFAGIAGIKIGAPFPWWRAHLPTGTSRVLVRLWPWILIAYLAWVSASWFIGAAFSDLMLQLAPLVTVATPVLLALILVTSFAYDTQTETETKDPESVDVRVRAMATRWASDDLPGWIEVFIQDSSGNPHLIVENVPILMDLPIPTDSSFPIELWIAAEMTQVAGEEVDVALSHSVETVDGVRRLTVSAADVIWP